jgi:hypothetical protein
MSLGAIQQVADTLASTKQRARQEPNSQKGMPTLYTDAGDCPRRLILRVLNNSGTTAEVRAYVMSNAMGLSRMLSR